jgi:3-hydroxyisobutyrate dehydrogenase
MTSQEIQYGPHTPIGFIGAGNMGGAVARRLASGGWPVRVYDPDPAAVDRCVAVGAVAAADLQESARDAGVVITSLPTPEILETTVGLILGTLKDGATILDISTVDPGTATRVAERVGAAGAHFVSCTLGKGPAQAEQGDIPLFIGGESAVVARLQPLLHRMGSSVHDMGSVEAAATFKIVSNLIGMTNLAVLVEGYALARRAGIPDEIFDQALKETGGTSYQQEVRLPWIMKRDWSPRFGVDLALKDLRLAVDSAWRWKIPVPVGSAALAQLAAASIHGMGSEDVVALAKVVDPGLN